MMTSDLPEVPAYFARDVAINRAGAASLDELPDPPAILPAKARERQDSGAILLDTRPVAAYGAGHVPGSVHIGLSGQFASWAGTLLPAGSEIVLIAEDPERVREARMRLARVGIENVTGYLAGCVEAWRARGLAGRLDRADHRRGARPADAGARRRGRARRAPARRMAGRAHPFGDAPRAELASRVGASARSRPSPRRDLRRRIPLLDRDEPSGAQGFPSADQRDRRNGSVERCPAPRRRRRVASPAIRPGSDPPETGSGTRPARPRKAQRRRSTRSDAADPATPGILGATPLGGDARGDEAGDQDAGEALSRDEAGGREDAGVPLQAAVPRAARRRSTQARTQPPT